MPNSLWSVNLLVPVFSGGSDGKESAQNLLVIQKTGVWILGGEGPLEKRMASLQYSCLKNSMDRGAWRATVHEIIKSQTRATNNNEYWTIIEELVLIS